MFEGIFQPMHWLVILIIVLVIFGPGKLPEVGSSLGKAVRGFKKAMDGPEKPPDTSNEVKKLEDKKE
jgi:sec-independent protein translocase protein TatA